MVPAAVELRKEDAHRGYRRDLQGLRAVAVLAVVIAHAGLPLAGGFTGVDIFFVISGFVITAALLRRLSEDGRMALGAFYLARIRRLLPALAVMLTLVLLASMALGAIGAMGTTARTGAAAALINANTYLMLFDTSGYFDAEAALNPLLHTWSLSVEEQFYLVFPGLLLATWVIARRRGSARSAVVWLLAVIAVSTLAAALVISLVIAPGDSSSLWGRIDYYSAPTRAWEFAAGGLLAAWALKRPTWSPPGWLANAGLVVLLIGFVAIPQGTTFPGPLALLPVAGAMLVIAGGTAKDSVGRTWLTTRPMAWLGDLSYSWYLWHWPIIVFAGIWWTGNRTAVVLAAVLSLAPAWLSMRFVEDPIRFRVAPTTRRTIGIAIACVVAPLVAAGLLLQWHATLKRDIALDPYALHLDALLGCESPQPLGSKPAECTWDAPGSTKQAVLIGDSLAGQYSEGFVAGMTAAGVQARVATLAGCPFIDYGPDASTARRLGMHPDRECTAFVRKSMKQLVADAPDVIVLPSAAQRYIEGRDPVREALWSAARGRMLEELSATGARVVMVGPVAKFDGWPPYDEGPFKQAAAGRVVAGSLPPAPTVAREQVLTRLAGAIAAEEAAAVAGGASMVDFFDEVCPEAVCRALTEDQLVYRDDVHLSVATSKALSNRFSEIAERALSR